MDLAWMPDFDPSSVVRNLSIMGIAYLLSLPIGWDREKAARSAGVRTFPLVAVSSCAFVLMAVGVDSSGSNEVFSRAYNGVITGLGFLGGGVILKQSKKVHGMTTAAAIWLTGALGMACALERYENAVALAAVCFFSLRYGKVVKPESDWDEGSNEKSDQDADKDEGSDR
ncbi:MgtC/SapB family protein [Verrucomicrobiaceae bacterium R5-34]|uniref:MgtC/SapB family protein n=1 Tax=Oceaniferula flava TaxID=2800421 RepID=A0AAE2SF31_9BACT|nr:MgtC/SapB family protein [Oceaniferula flavus]MBK1831216.1 MgtC/SapB family protein [Verrucomicrobiaceae bacterium R5-34]MBK1855385.1 MgtC/SapB family protein [Oceaniferula flavus]